VSRARRTPLAAKASERARKSAVAVLQVMAGLRTPVEASAALGVTANRYYQLETRGLQALLSAMEPRPRGRTVRPEHEMERLSKEKARAEREAARYLALLRASQKALGLAPKGADARDSRDKRGRRRRPRMRAETLISALEASGAVGEAEPAAEVGETR
jgi:hypothetical protein